MVYFDQILHIYIIVKIINCLTPGIHNSLFDGRGLAEHQFGWLWSVSEDAHNSLNA